MVSEEDTRSKVEIYAKRSTITDQNEQTYEMFKNMYTHTHTHTNTQKEKVHEIKEKEDIKYGEISIFQQAKAIDLYLSLERETPFKRRLLRRRATICQQKLPFAAIRTNEIDCCLRLNE